jgi:hypothetical protein
VPNARAHRLRGRLFLLSGLGLAVLGIAAYVVQVSSQRLTVPWYMPALAALGAALVVISLLDKRNVWRLAALLALVLLTAAEMAFLHAVRLPPYTGSIVVGQQFPPFQAKRADGAEFTQRDLTGDSKNVIVVFRGRW